MIEWAAWDAERLARLSPWLLGLAACLWIASRLWGQLPKAPPKSPLRGLHASIGGAAASLDLVLILPILAVLLLFIAQLGILLNAQLVMGYAAHAAARSAIVWSNAEVEDEVKIDHVEGAAALAVMPIATRLSRLETLMAGGTGLLGGVRDAISAAGDESLGDAGGFLPASEEEEESDSGSGDFTHELWKLSGSPLALHSPELLASDTATQDWRARLQAGTTEAPFVAAYMALSSLGGDTPRPSGFPTRATDFSGTGASGTAVAQRRAWGALGKYLHARACTVVEYEPATGNAPVTVTVRHQLTLKVPFVGLFFDDAPEDWTLTPASDSAWDEFFPERTPPSPIELDTPLGSFGLPLGKPRPFIRTLTESATLVNQGKYEGQGCR